MEKYTERIKKFGKAAHILLQIAFWTLTALFAVFALAYILKLAGVSAADYLTSKITLREGTQVENINIVMPGFDFDGYGMSFAVTTASILEYAVTLVALAFAKRVFKTLSGDGNPFCAEVVSGFKRLAIALLAVGVFGGVIGFVGAATIAVMCMIFDYGSALHRESETTL